MAGSWGAIKAEWEALAKLCLRDVRPCVCNPNLFTKPTKLMPDSIRAGDVFSKRPSRIYSDGLVAGVTGWPAMNASKDDVRGWFSHADLGAGMVGRTIHAIDIDVDDEDAADEIDGYLCKAFPFDPPARTRPDTGRRLLLFRTSPTSPHNKVVHNTQHGAVEWLFERQFFVLAGIHKSGHRYEWPDGMPTNLDAIPAISEAELDELIRRFGEDFGCSPVTTTTTGLSEPRAPGQADEDNPAYRYVLASDYFRQTLPDGALAVVCPWHKHHESSNGAREDGDPTKVVFFPAGVGGRESPGYKCMHAGHPHKHVGDFLDAIGYSIVDEFPLVKPPVKHLNGHSFEPPTFDQRSEKTGRFPSSEINLNLALQDPRFLDRHLAYDDFQQQYLIRPGSSSGWRLLRDADYTEIAVKLNRQGMTSINTQKLKSAVLYQAERNRIDEARDWCNALEWDGTDRFSDFPSRVWRNEDNPYHLAVVRYLFTAAAGRLIEPGVKADMAVILHGPQGVRKSTFAELLAPLPGSYGVHDFTRSDADAARMARGKSILELEELRGLSTKDEESIKSWMTRTEDEWTPKYKEFATKAQRRFIALGTTNPRRVLSDSTGNRRWLPLTVCAIGSPINTDYLAKHHDQLWAQGAALFREHGVLWQDAERLARNEVGKYTRLSSTTHAVLEYLTRHPGEYSTVQLLRNVMCKEPNNYHAQRDMAKLEHAMMQVGYVDNGDGIWRLPFL